MERAKFRGESQVDVKLVMDVVRDLDFDVFVLGSGDGDFLELFKYLKEKGKQVEVVCVRGDIDKTYLSIADSITFISEGDLYEVSTSEKAAPQRK